jgi:fucose permease
VGAAGILGAGGVVTRTRLPRSPVVLAYATFVLIGVSAGVTGVLLLAQIRDYGVDRATIGITFFTGSAGFVLAGFTAGTVIHGSGTRIALVIGGSGYVLAGLYTATRPPFVAFVIVQLVTGYATGVLESVLNAYLSASPNATTLLNRLHAFFGVGALLGPVLATWILGFASWTTVWLVLAMACVPLVAGFLVCYPRPHSDATALATAPHASEPASGGLLRTALRQRGVLLGAAFLAVYVGLEIGMGDWGFGYLVQERGQSELLAGYSVSGYWLGLTLGRFLISPLATRIGATAAGMMLACLAGVTVAAALTWLLPAAAAASTGFVLLGFFLGPIFPTTMAMAPQLTIARLVPTAIGVMSAGSVVGGSALPWLAGAIAQNTGVWTLLPFTVTLALLQLAVWWPIAHRIRTPSIERPLL